ncbi:thioredoxin family protein [Brachyspira aalborgi]|uniref:Thioredoxin family protein n=1 Tax=Brachyspira aalborgi TaxID=29522 RepID=A0A5C8D8T8_9SPIR|nr:thioredoxin-like (seleno)protein SaoT [Brachyspira aalborgi]TXJ20562.1 thioredoxin family protein [Brachyspira aalborgi]
MSKMLVEFINTCSTCDGYSSYLNELYNQYRDKIELKIYYAGKDFDYIQKYGIIDRGTLIINGKNRYEILNKKLIEKEIKAAIENINN